MSQLSRKARIEFLLNQEITPIYLHVEDESKKHQVPKDAETHFKLIVVSSCFINLPLIARHKLVHELLKKEFELGLHALSMHLYTPDEWEKDKLILNSPGCLHGYKNK
jgi:BolA protein